jgi:Reverse transcriptase (RNA-dependent DNA polymerase)
LLELIAAANSLSCLVGDVGNAFISALTNKKVYCIAGPDFRCLGKEGCILIVHRSLYGLKTSAKRWHALFADTLHSFGFQPTRFDRDGWFHDRSDGFDYICTHVDNFKIFAKDPSSWMEKLQEVYLIKDPGPPSYYLGTDYV